MTYKKTACLNATGGFAVTAMLLAMAAPNAGAQALPAGATPADKTMTCADVTAERGVIEAAVANKAEKKQQAAKTKKKLFGFAKTFAGLALPGAGALVGGGSMLGSIAAQSATQTASQAVSSMQVDAPVKGEARPDEVQQARLDRLAKIGAYRQCGA